MWNNILIGCGMTLITIVVHSVTSWFIMEFVNINRSISTHIQRISFIALIFLIILIATMVETFIWASAYLFLDAFSQSGDAVYFSLVTYTTLGYGDLVLNPEVRIVGAIQAVNGVLIFGWSTAIIVAVLQNVYTKHS